MTASRGKGFVGASIAAVLAVGLSLGPVPLGAQGVTGSSPEVSKPLILAPPTRLDPLPPPESQEPTVGRPADEAPSGISVDSLQAVAPGSVGILTEANGGLGSDMWNGTPREEVDVLVPLLPVRAVSSAMHDLGRRLLLSVAALPEGQSDTNLTAARAERLVEMGETKALFDLLVLAPREARDGRLSKVEADARFMTNDLVRACELAGAQPEALADTYWQQVFIFCQLLAGDRDKADLGVSLLRETGHGDAVFFRLAEALAADKSAELDSMRDPTPLLLAMARAAQAELPPDVLATDGPGLLRTIAVSPNASFNIRLDAAERAEGAGALSTEALRELYAGAKFGDDELAKPLSVAEDMEGPLGRALLYQTAVANTVPSARAEAAGHALDLAKRNGRFPSVARAFADILADLQPSAELSWFAPTAVRALLVANVRERAEPWLGQLRAGALADEERAARLTAVLPLVYIAGATGPGGWSMDNLEAWWQREAEGPGAWQRATLLYTVLEGLGNEVPDSLWLDLLGTTERSPAVLPGAALWFRLRDAAEAEREGETVLLSLLALGDGGPQQASPIVLRAVIDGLSRIGEAPAARQLALEAAIAAGL